MNKKNACKYRGRPCPRCQNTLRYVANNKCVTCAIYWSKLGPLHQKQRIRMVGKPCAICRRPMAQPCYDHEVVSEIFRGWLCHKCNRALGAFGESILLLKRAVVYLGG